MGKTKSAQPVKASKTSKDTQVKSISSVKEGAVTKPSQTPKAKSKEMANQVAMNVGKAGKKSQKGKKEPTPISSSESESESEEEEDDQAESHASSASSDEESEEEAPAPKHAAKTNGVKANGVAKVAAKVDAESSDSSDSSASDDEAKPAAKAGADAKDAFDSEEEGTSEGTSEESSEEESDEEDEAPKVPSPVNAKALKGKLENVASKEASSEGESGSDASSDTSASSSEEDDSEEEEAPAPKKRKAEAEATPAAKKAKTDIDLNDESKKNLFIGHLSYNVDEEWLTREFEKFGELTRVKVMTDRESGQSRGFGYVEFAVTADAVKAHEEMQDVEIDGRAINVDFSKPKDAATPRQDRQKSFGDSVSAPSETLFVANLPFDVTEDAVGEEFGKHASVLGVRLPTDMNSGAPKGFGYVQFASVEDAKEAFGKMTGATIMGRPIRLDYSTPRPPRNNDSPGGRGGHGGFDRGGRGGGRGRGGFDRGGRGGGRGGFDRGRGGRGGASTNRGGVGEFKGQKMRLE